jgi:hypothetical protein
MSVLVIRRTHTPHDLGRSYRVMVDGTQRALIGNDAAVQITLTPGDHVVRLKARWCRSREMRFPIRHGEVVRMECRPGSPWLALFYLTFWRDKYISLETVTN